MGYQLRRRVMFAAQSTGWARVVVGEVADAIPDDAPTSDAWPGIERLARMLGVSTDTISRAVKDAEAAGDLTVLRHPGHVNRYVLSQKLAATCGGPQDAGTSTLRVDPPQDAGTTTRNLRGEYPQVAALTTREPQEEPQMNAQGENDTTDTGPIPFSDPDPFTKAARRAGIGNQPSRRSISAKQKAAEKFDLGELENAPAIKVHRAVCGIRPLTREQAEQIVASVNGDAETTWRDNLTFWMARGYMADSVDKQLDRYGQERFRVTARAIQPVAATIGVRPPSRGMYPQVTDLGAAEFAAAEERARAQRAERAARKAALTEVSR